MKNSAVSEWNQRRSAHLTSRRFILCLIGALIGGVVAVLGALGSNAWIAVAGSCLVKKAISLEGPRGRKVSLV